VDSLYAQATTGKKLTRASDDPTAASGVLGARGDIAGADRYLDNMQTAQTRLDSLDGYLKSAETAIARARELAVAGANGALSDDDRQSYAEEAAALQEQLLGIANARVEGTYLFAGYSDSQAPFSGEPVSYDGTDDHKYLRIGPDQTVATSVTGAELFMEPVDVFAALSTLEEALSTGDDTVLGEQLDVLTEAADQVVGQRGKMGNINARLDDNISLMEDARLQMRETLSGYEDADLAEVLSDMTLAEQSLEAALSISARLASLSILDYL